LKWVNDWLYPAKRSIPGDNPMSAELKKYVFFLKFTLLPHMLPPVKPEGSSVALPTLAAPAQSIRSSFQIACPFQGGWNE
jgi:hypothetical protein